MLDIIISSKTRIKLLIKFFLFDDNVGYLRNMEREFNESSNSIRLELNKFTEAGLLTSEFKGKKRFYKANPKHPLYDDLKRIVRKTVGIDQIIERVTSKLGNLEAAYITGSLASGVDSDTVELALVGTNLDKNYIDNLVDKAENLIERKIMYLTVNKNQMEYFFKNKPALLIWTK
jgi:DNA-binding transcriptional ArsR family regulator